MITRKPWGGKRPSTVPNECADCVKDEHDPKTHNEVGDCTKLVGNPPDWPCQCTRGAKKFRSGHPQFYEDLEEEDVR